MDRFHYSLSAALLVLPACGDDAGETQTEDGTTSSSTTAGTTSSSAGPSSTADSTSSADSGSTSTTSDPDTGTTASESSSSGGPSSSSETGEPSECGNSIVEGDEICDDGNDVDGDGCNTDCIESGTPLLTLTYDSPAHDSDLARAVSVDPSGDFVVAGAEFRDDDSEDWNMWLRKYTEDGDVVWTRTLDVDNGRDRPNGVDTDAAGNIAVTGEADVTGQGFNVWTGVYDSDGDLQWDEQYDGFGSQDDLGLGVGFDSFGSVYVGGRITLPFQSVDAWVGKYNESGAPVWDHGYNAVDGDDRCRDLAVTASGVNVCAGRETLNDLEGGANALLIVRDRDGFEQWTATYNSPADLADSFYAVAVSDAGDVVGCGRSLTSTSPDDYDVWIRKYDAAGDLEWATTWDPGDEVDNLCYSTALDADGNVIIGGRIVNDDHDAWVRKYDPDGDLLWEQTHDGADGGSDGVLDVDVWPDGRIVAVGWEENSSAGEDNNMWIQVYAP